jgi:hypothetical protein
VSYTGQVQLGSFAIQETNSWLDSFDVTADDFLSLNIDSASSQRQADGSLPAIDFLHLAQGSDLIDAGVDLGFPYYGEKPDLGAFESDYTTSIIDVNTLANNFELFQNYPNPFNPVTRIRFDISHKQKISLKIYDVLDREVATLVDNILSQGSYEYHFNAGNLAGGVYFYQLKAGNDRLQTRKMILVK